MLERSESVPVLDRRQVLVSFVLLATLTLPLTFLHEAGHALICVYRDVPIISIGLGYTECAFKSADHLYYAFGGLFAAMILLAPLVRWNWIIRNKGVLVFLLALSTYNLYSAGIETLAHDEYVMLTNSNVIFDMTNAMIFLGLYMGLFVRLLRRN